MLLLKLSWVSSFLYFSLINELLQRYFSVKRCGMLRLSWKMSVHNPVLQVVHIIALVRLSTDKNWVLSSWYIIIILSKCFSWHEGFVCYWISIIQIHFDLKFQSAANFSANNLPFVLCLDCMTSLDHFENTPKNIHCFGTFWNNSKQQILSDMCQKTLNNSSLHCLLWHTMDDHMYFCSCKEIGKAFAFSAFQGTNATWG